jgi:hypothetical protein
MTDDIKEKALALVNEIEREEGATELTPGIMRLLVMDEALCRAIEQHEAFKQEVSHVVSHYWDVCRKDRYPTYGPLQQFIIPTPKPDPLAEMLEKDFGGYMPDADDFRAALDARGLEIRTKANDR